MNFGHILGNSIERKGDYLPGLDGWRAIAILLVIIGHAMDDLTTLIRVMGFGFEPAGLKFVGMQGVQLFFGLSGFLITRKLIEDEIRHGRISLWAFYVRRTFRILPATLFFLLAVGALSMAGILDISLGRWVASLLFAANYASAEYSWYLGHFWSLALEEHFYLVWPAAFLALGVVRRRLAWAFALALAIALWRAIDFKFQITGSSPALFMGRTDIRADHIAWGVVVSLALADPAWQPRLQRWLGDPRIATLLMLVLAGLLFVYDVDWKLKFALMTLHGIVVPLVIASTILNATSGVVRWLENPLLRFIGRLSFSVYLWQQLFFVWVESKVPALQVFQEFPANLMALVVCALISFRLVEEPCIALGRRVLRRWPAWGIKRYGGLPVVEVRQNEV